MGDGKEFIMIVIFIIDDKFEVLHFTTPDEFSKVLNGLGVEPDRVKFKAVALESLMMLLENQVQHFIR